LQLKNAYCFLFSGANRIFPALIDADLSIMLARKNCRGNIFCALRANFHHTIDSDVPRLHASATGVPLLQSGMFIFGTQAANQAPNQLINSWRSVCFDLPAFLIGACLKENPDSPFYFCNKSRGGVVA
jgi:hypothetical protein